MTLGVALFVLGFSAVFVVTGYLLGEAGFLLIRWRDPLTRVSGVFVILLGLAFVGQIGVLQRTLKPRWMPAPGLVGAPLLGGVFAVGWTPCLGPTLAAINTLALQSGRAGQGAILATVYSVGLGLPFVVLAFGFGWATSAVRFLRQRVRATNLIGGGVLVTIGILMVSGVWLALTSELQARWASFVPAL
jgi:cytochrome c-type biogenesis protein